MRRLLLIAIFPPEHYIQITLSWHDCATPVPSQPPAASAARFRATPMSRSNRTQQKMTRLHAARFRVTRIEDAHFTSATRISTLARDSPVRPFTHKSRNREFGSSSNATPLLPPSPLRQNAEPSDTQRISRFVTVVSSAVPPPRCAQQRACRGCRDGHAVGTTPPWRLIFLCWRLPVFRYAQRSRLSQTELDARQTAPLHQ